MPVIIVITMQCTLSFPEIQSQVHMGFQEGKITRLDGLLKEFDEGILQVITNADKATIVQV
jgi:C4-type Zn-finger protein